MSAETLAFALKQAGRRPQQVELDFAGEEAMRVSDCTPQAMRSLMVGIGQANNCQFSRDGKRTEIPLHDNEPTSMLATFVQAVIGDAINRSKPRPTQEEWDRRCREDYLAYAARIAAKRIGGDK